MKRTILSIITIILLGVQSTATQSATSDSLEDRLDLVETDERIPILLELVKLNHLQNPEKAIRFGEEAERLLNLYPDSEKLSLLKSRLGWVYLYRGEFERVLELANQAEQHAFETFHNENMARAKLLKGRTYRETDQFDHSLAVLDSALVLVEQSADSILRASILNEVGSVYRRKGDSPKALDYHTRALKLIENSGQKEILSSTYTHLGINHDIIGNYDEALNFHLQALRVREDLNDRRGVAASMTNLGILHQQIGQYEKAMEFYQEVLPIWRELEADGSLASTLNNIGTVQELMGNYQDARTYYEQAHEIWSEQGNLYSMTISLNNLGTIHRYLGDYEKAMEFKQKALQNHLQMGDNRGASGVLNNIALIYMDTGQPDSALASAKQSLDFAHETGSWRQILNAHELMSDIYEQTGDFQRALEQYKLYKAASDTLFNSDSQAVIAELQEQYRTRQQQQQIELLQHEREHQRLWFIIMAGGLTTALITFGFMYNRYKLNLRNRQKLHEAEMEKARLHAESVEAKTKLLDAENRRKTKELEDARQLQLSMLPASLPECKVAVVSAFMETAQEVGGDFYDMDLSDDEILTLCIGDATGHGTKSGLLVTAMKSLFNLMAFEQDLKTVFQRSSQALKKMNLPQLYMAFAMARLEKNTLTLIGAGMPPAHIYRAGTGTVETVNLKGMPLGSVPDYPYELKELEMNKDDVLLLLSDGYPELTNDEEEMLGYHRPAEILASSGHLHPDQIIEVFKKSASDWLGNKHPNDDLTFVVLKKS